MYRVEAVEGGVEPAEETAHSGAGGQSTQHTVLPDQAQAFAHLAPDIVRLMFFFGDMSRFGLPYQAEEEGRPEKGESIEGDGDGRGQKLYEQTSQGGASHFGKGAGDAQLAVGLHNLVAAHKGGQVGAVGHVEEESEDAHDRRHYVEMPYAEDVEQSGNGHESEGQSAGKIGHYQDRATLEAVNPHSGEEAEGEHRYCTSGSKVAHLRRAGRHGQYCGVG